MTTREALTILDLSSPISRESLREAFEEGMLVWRPERFAGNAALQARAVAKRDQLRAACQWLDALPEGEFPYHAADVHPMQQRPAAWAEAEDDAGPQPPRVPRASRPRPKEPVLQPMQAYEPWQKSAQVKRGPGSLTVLAWGMVIVGGGLLIGLLVMLFPSGKPGGAAEVAAAPASGEPGVAEVPPGASAQAGVAASTPPVRAPQPALSLETIMTLPPPVPVHATVSPGNMEMEELRALAERGDAVAQYCVGVYCATDDNKAGDSSEPGYAKAMKWFRLAAEQGLPDAQYMLGRVLVMGLHVKKDEAEGLKWLYLAASQGFARAMDAMGEQMLVLEHRQVAAEWFRRAAEAGVSNAQLQLGRMLSTGKGVAVDKPAAYYWISRAMMSSQKLDQYHLAEAQKALDAALASMTSGELVDGQNKVREWQKEHPEPAQAAAPASKPEDAPATPAPAAAAPAGRLDLPPDELRALAQQGDAEAQYLMGMCHAFGMGVLKDQAAAAEWFLRAAMRGLPKAQTRVGIAYFYGEGVKKDPAEAMKWLLRGLKGDGAAGGWLPRVARELSATKMMDVYRWAMAGEQLAAAGSRWSSALSLADVRQLAQQGDAQAQLDMGLRHCFGAGVSADMAEAVGWLRKAAEQGVLQAQRQLARCLMRGDGAAQDVAEALRWYRAAAEQGDAFSQFQMGEACRKGKDMPADAEAATGWYRKAAAQGYAPAQSEMGLACLTGSGVAQDSTAAVGYFRQAAAQGNADGQYNLGFDLLYGLGVAKDPGTGTEWLLLAGEQGHPGAQMHLGLAYLSGNGVDKNPISAVLWLNRAAAQGLDEAQYELGTCYEDGVGVPKDAATAVEWYAKSAAQGFAKAQNYLGTCRETGIGGPVDLADAVKWYRQAAEQGNGNGEYNLGRCYQSGLGVEKDSAEGVKWYRKAAERGYAFAQNNLGNCYQSGNGVPADAVEAVNWYRKAAEQGLDAGLRNMGSCHESGTGVEQDLVEAMKWYLIAATKGDSTAIEWAEALKLRLTPEQRAQAERRAEAFQKAQKG